jgi:hypothetical protein
MEVFIMFENNDYIYMTRKEYNIWINNMYESYVSYEEKHFNNIKFMCNNKSLVIVNLNNGKSAMARCHKSDNFITKTGIAIAWAKYNHSKIPRIIEQATDLKVDDEVLIELQNVDKKCFYNFVIAKFKMTSMNAEDKTTLYTFEGSYSRYKNITTKNLKNVYRIVE